MRNPLVVFLLLLLFSDSVGGQECIDYTRFTRIIADIPLGGTCGASIDLQGDYAYVAGVGGYLDIALMTVDISNPRQPELVGYHLTGYEDLTGIAVEGAFAYLTYYGKLEVFDIQDPASPVSIAKTSIPPYPCNIALSGNHALVVDESSGLGVISVEDPYQPVEVARIPLEGHVQDMAVLGDHAFIINLHDFLVVDISDPTNPVIVETLVYEDEYLFSVEAWGERIYLTSYSQNTTLHVFDVSLPASPVLLGEGLFAAGLRVVSVDGKYACLTGEGLFVLVDVTSPENQEELIRIRGAGAMDAELANGFVFLGSEFSYNRFQVIELLEHDAPSSIASYPSNSGISDVEVGENLAYILKPWYEDLFLLSIDLPNGYPVFPNLDIMNIGPSNSGEIYLHGDILAVATGNHLRLVDVTDPTDMVLKGSVIQEYTIRGVVFQGDLMFVVDAWGLRIYNISDWTNPIEICSMLAEYTTGMDIQGWHLYLANPRIGLGIYDVSDPLNPLLIGEYEEDSLAYSVDVDGDYAYVGGYEFSIFNISDPENPVLEWQGGALGSRVRKNENFAVLGYHHDMVTIFDVSKPTNPVYLASPSYKPHQFLDWDIAYGKLYFASVDGVLVYPGHCSAPSGIPMSATTQWGGQLVASPNPFNPVTQISFDLPEATMATLRVYGIDGRQATELFSGHLEAGDHSLLWTGRDQAGRVLPSGLISCA